MCGDDHFSRKSDLGYKCPECGEVLYMGDYPENYNEFECRTDDCAVDGVTLTLTTRKRLD